MNEQVFFTQVELADRWRMSLHTLEGWRKKGIGLAWTKIGNRVRYHIDDIEEYKRMWRSGANPK